MTGTELIESYRAKGVDWKGTVLLPTPVALKFLEHCKEQEVRLLGVDAFSPPAAEMIQARFEDSLDLSGKEFWDYSIAELCELAKEFIESVVGEERLFEFVVDD